MPGLPGSRDAAASSAHDSGRECVPWGNFRRTPILLGGPALAAGPEEVFGDSGGVLAGGGDGAEKVTGLAVGLAGTMAGTGGLA